MMIFLHKLSSDKFIQAVYNIEGIKEKIVAAVLIVEDDPICQKINSSLCRLAGLETDIATCGNEAISMATTQKYDLILMDIGLPDISGTQVASQVKEKKPHIPIIAVTAHMGKDQPNGPFSDVVHKPLMKDILKKIVEKFVK